jgi:hypothetical protein
MREIARGPLGSELQKTEARASMPQRQSPAPIEANGFLSQEGEGPRKSLLTVVCEYIAGMFNCLFEMITRLFPGRGCVSAVERRASEPSELVVNSPIGKRPRRRIIHSPQKEPAIKSDHISYKPAPLTSPAFFPKEDTAKVKPRKSERSSGWSAGTPSSSTTPSRWPRRSIQQISAISRDTLRGNDSSVIRTPENPQLTSSVNLNPRMLLTYKPTKNTPE